MIPTEIRPLSECFDQGMQARRDRKSIRDNPYCAGSDQRLEWDVGFQAKLDVEDEDQIGLDPNENSEIRTSY